MLDFYSVWELEMEARGRHLVQHVLESGNTGVVFSQLLGGGITQYLSCVSLGHITSLGL